MQRCSPPVANVNVTNERKTNRYERTVALLTARHTA